MIVEQVFRTADVFNHMDRVTVYKNILDPVTNKKFVEIADYLYVQYTEKGQLSKHQPSGQHIDQAV
jgi:hypothetical protein